MFRAGAISTAGDLSCVRIEREIPSRIAYAYVETRDAFARKGDEHYRLFYARYAGEYRAYVADDRDRAR